jgi:hypothetical protein
LVVKLPIVLACVICRNHIGIAPGCTAYLIASLSMARTYVLALKMSRSPESKLIKTR